MGYRVCPSHARLSGPPPHPHPGEEGLWGGRVPAGTGAWVPVRLLPQLSATGPAAGRGQARLSAQSERAGGRTPTRARVGAGRGGARQRTLTQQQYVLPRWELGARAGGDLAEDAGPSREQRRTLRPGTAAPPREGRTRPWRAWAGAAENAVASARDPEVSPGPGVSAGTQGRVGSLPKVLPVLVVARCGAAVARR